MRRDKVLRFLGIAFALGAFLGLVSGLAFGGSSAKTGTPKIVAPANSDTGSVSGAAGATTSTFAGPMTEAKAAAIGANELGEIPVLLYGDVRTEPGDGVRSPQDLAKDIEYLKAEGFQPVNLRDLASGNIDIPAGTSPVVLTFDGSTIGQYDILDDGTLSPESAVGVLQAAVDAGGWKSKATFYCLLDVTSKDSELFGQSDRQQEKLRNLVDWGYEIGSHTVTNLNLQKASAADVQRELGDSQQRLQTLIRGGYNVTSLAVPAGDYPADERLLASGTFNGKPYSYTSAVTLGEHLSPSPFSTLFDGMHIQRLTVKDDTLRTAIEGLKSQPGLRYISDGDPTSVSAPKELAASLGAVRDDLGRPLIRY
jgi:peptidoglycan/xylan/chitin deacetylase (PgdA/CDA1 family)